MRHLHAVPDDPHPDEPEVIVPDPPKPPHAPDIAAELFELLADITVRNPYRSAR